MLVNQLRIGATTPTTLRLGTVPVERAYLGDVLVYGEQDDPVPSYSNLVLGHSPLLYWRLGDTSGTAAVDSSGNGRSGTYINNPSLGDSPLLANDGTPSIYFHKFDDQRVEGSYGAWMNASAVTVTCAYRCMYDGGGNVIEALAARYWDTTSDISWLLYCENSEFKFFYRTTGGSIVTIASGVTRNLGDTYYVAAYAGATGAGIRIYSGGVLLGSATGTAAAVASSSRPLTVAATDAGGSDNRYTIEANLQEVAYFGALLPLADIDTLASVATAPQPQWRTRTAGVAPRNGTAVHALSFAPANSGALLVAVVGGGVTSTAITPGWTKQLGPVQSVEVAVFTCSASGGETSLNLTHNGSNYPINYAIYEFPAGTTWVGGVYNPNGPTPALSGLPGTPAVAFSLIGMDSVSLSPPPVETWWRNGWTEDFDTMTTYDGVTDGIYLAGGWRKLYAETTVSPATDGNYGGSVYVLANQLSNITTLTFALSLPG